MPKTITCLGGGPELVVHGEEVNVRQQPQLGEHWQNSVVLVWWDERSSVGGFHRLGHEPNYKDGPHATLWNNLFLPEGVYKNTTFKPLRTNGADYLPHGGFGCGDDTCTMEVADDKHIWKIADGRIRAHLTAVDIGPNVDPFPKKGSLAENFTSAHFDIPVRIHGWVEIAGQDGGDSHQYPVECFGIRDNGWGKRDWTTVLTHRWVVGSAGPAFSFVALSWLSSDDALASFGWVIREGNITMVQTLDILAYVEIDGATNRGGHLKLALSTGEVLDIEITPYQGVPAIASYHHTVCSMDRLCSFTCNDNLTSYSGVCDFETTHNIQQGARRPTNFTNAIIENGFHPK